MIEMHNTPDDKGKFPAIESMKWTSYISMFKFYTITPLVLGLYIKHNRTKKNAHRSVVFRVLGTLGVSINILATIVDWWTEMARLLHSLVPIDGAYYVHICYALTLTFDLFWGTICSSNNTISIRIRHFPNTQFMLTKSRITWIYNYKYIYIFFIKRSTQLKLFYLKRK